MSDLSLSTGVYANIEKHGVLIDRVIERLGREKAAPTDPDQKKMAQPFVGASALGLESQSSEALILDGLLRTRSGKPLADLKQLGERLQKGDVDQACLRQLGEFAQGLEQERANIARRLRKR